MATVRIPFEARSALQPSTNSAQLWTVPGTNGPLSTFRFDAATEQAIFFDFPAEAYGSGDVTVDVLWYAATATTGVVRWGAQLRAITPDVDTQDNETDTFATLATFDDTHLGTTAKRIHRAPVVITAVDSLAARDSVQLRVARIAAHANDTLSGFVHLERIVVNYSDT